MSDLFKDQRPELSDDEDRRLWQRVRAIPDEVAAGPRRELAPARVPWWRALWAMPAVRYGAPALAVLLIAVVWVTERQPTPPARTQAERVTPRVTPRVLTEVPSTPPSATKPAPPGRSADYAPPPGGSGSTRARAQNRPSGDAALRPQTESAQELVTGKEVTVLKAAEAPPADASHPRLDKEESGAASAPAPRAQREARPSAGTEPQQKSTFAAPPKPADSAAPAPATPTPAPSNRNWGMVRSGYRDSGPSTPGNAEELSLRGLPSRAGLARHELVALALDTPELGPIDFWGSLPRGTDWGPDSKALIHVIAGPDGPPHVTFVAAKALRRFLPGDDYEYEAAPPRVQAALLAALLERALLDPTTVPRHRIEELLEAARRVERRGGAGQGAGALVRTVETALESWPATR